MADKQIYIKISADSAQPVAAVKAMRNELSRLQKAYDAINTSTATGAQRAQKLQKEMADLRALIKQQEADMNKVSKVITNLSNASLSQLNQALRQVKKEISRTSESSPKLEELRQKYKAITDQIKVMNGEMINIKKHMGELSTQTDSWLQRAINQQKQLVESTQKTSSAYQGQVNILHQLQNEQARRAVSTISDGGASADALRTARANLVSYRDQLGKGGILPASGNVATEIERINAELKKCDDQLDAIAGKEKQIELTTDQLQQKADNIILDPKKFSPKEIKAAIDEIQKRLNNLGTNDTARKKLNEQMKQLKNILDGVDHELVNIGDLLKPANLRKAPLETLQKAAKQLENEMAKLNRDQQQYIDKQKQLAAIRGEIERTTGAINRQGSAWKTTFRNISMYFGVFQLFSIAQQKLQGMLQSNLAYSDQLADIRKVTGLATKEVNELSDSLATLNTRSTVQDLADLAYQGGKMGFGQYGVEGMAAFVRAADQVKVALSDDLGDDSLLQISKLVDTMGLIPKLGVERSMLAVGSSINQLSATSTASGTHIVDFAKRLTGLSRITGITTPELLALGSAADALGQAPEVAATAFGKLFTSLQTNHNLIEQQLNMEKGTINNLFSQGKAMEAILQIMEKMREKGNMNALGNIWKDLGSEGQRLIGVMATMSKNVDTVRAHVEESNVAFEEATSLTNEYALKQDTANAILEKGNNLWAKAFTNPEGVDMVKQMAQAWYDLSKSMTSNEASMWIMKNLLGLIAGELKILLALLPAILTGLLFKGASVAIIGLASSIGLMGKNAVLATLQTKGLVAAWHALNTAQKMNVIGLCISLLTGLAIAIASVIKKGNEATQWMQGFNSTMSDFNREFAIADDRLKRFKKAIDDAATGSRQRAAAIRNFNKEYGQYLSKMLTEKSTADDIAKAYKEVVKQLRAKIALQMKEKDITSQVAPRIGWSADRLTEYDNVAGGSAYNGTWLKAYVDDMRAAGKSVEDINNDLAKKLGVEGKVARDAYNRRSDKTLRTTFFDQESYQAQAQYDMDGGFAAARNTTRALTQAEQMLYAATRYATQAYSASNAMNRVNKKWKPFEEDLSTVTDETPGTLDNDAVDKEAEKRRKAEEAARRKALRAEMKEEQAKAQAIVDNVKNYYERQIAAITEMATKTGMDSELQKKLIDGMTVRMNNALANVRQAIAGTENDWADFRQSMINDLYEPLSEDGTNQSTQLLDNIIHNDIDKLKEMITVLSKELGQNGSVLLDQIWRKATENQLANAKQENKAYQERQKVLLEKNYTGKVNLDYENQMEQFGVAELTSEQIAKMMGWSQKGNNEAIQQFLDDRTEQWQKAFASARKNVVDLLSVDANSEDAPDKVLTILFGKDYKSYLAGTGLSSLLNMSADQFKVFYQKLIEYSDAYTDAQKKAYDEAKRRADFIFNNNPTIQSIDQSTQQLSTINSDQQRFESDKNIGQQMGMSWNIDSDPEILRYRLLAERARLYYEDMARLREQDKISEQQLTDAKRQMMEAQSNMADQVARKFHERVSLLQNFSEPLNTFAEGVGESLGNMIYDTEQSDVKMKDLLKDMLKSYVKMSLQLIAQDLTRRVTKQLYYRQEEMDETMHQQTMLQIQQLYQSLMLTAQTTGDAARLTQHATSNATELSAEAGATTGKVGLGIAGGAAKIIGTLGFWGIPLIGVITALLMGLLSWAIGLAFGGDDSGASASDATPNVKLATGMLTYDSGNVQSVGNGSPVASPSGYAPSASPGGSGAPVGSAGGDRTPVLGSDGYVYQARQVPQLQTGLVTSPIATMVNGQPSLVGERGPEMVIGRETTAAMQMARPDLLAAIVKFDKNYSNGHAYRTYDEGNLSDFATVPDGSPSGEGTLTKEDIDGLRSSLSEFTAVMLAIKRNGLHVNKYGRGGIAQESQDGANFMRRNSGDRLWKG